MTDDIQFGDVQEAAPEKHLRPDRNAHYAVVGYEHPVDGELPIFVDLDVLRDMEEHAASDKTVELGGVLLGGQYHDEDGKPFVVITDSLRAQHYESTKGSFKFTHETWSQINRQRNEYPPELQMVGWYHTHPDWGVFLSGMDMFICDHFFNRPLDVAYVIDPCRGDRAMFQWTGNPRERVRRTGGFFVMASRYRAAELAFTVAQLLAGSDAMPSDPRMTNFPGMAPVVNISQPPQQPYQGIAVLGMLTIQACLLMLIAWKMLAPPGQVATAKDEQLAKLEKKIDAIHQQDDVEMRMEAQRRVLDQVMTELKGEPRGIATALEERERQNAELRASLRGQDAWNKSLKDEKDKIELSAKAKTEKLESELKIARDDQKKLQELTGKLEDLQAKLNKETKKEAAESGTNYTLWYWVGGAVVAIAALGGLFATFAYKSPEAEPIDTSRLAPAPGANAKQSTPATNSLSPTPERAPEHS